MKKIGCILCLLLCFMTPLHADSYCVLIDGDNSVVEEKDMHKTQSVASISKIMTAVIALEYGDLKDTWKCGKELSQAYGSMIYLKVGQRVSLQSLLYGLMLRSGNDAALEIALHISKSEKAFVKLMNKKAAEIGMLNTTFRNASGLDEEDGGNISSAYDMALLMSYAMKQKEFAKITGTLYYDTEWNYRWKNKNSLLFDYAFANGGKTGFTKKAGRTLVTSAKHDGMESIVVTLQTSDDFKFHKQKHQEVSQAYKVITLLKKGTYMVNQKTFQVPKAINVSVKKDGSEKINTTTHFEDQNFIVEVDKKKHVDVYSFPYKKQETSLFHKG